MPMDMLLFRPSEKWVPERQSFVEEKNVEEPTQLETVDGQVQQVIDTPEGQFTITFTPKEKEMVLDRNSQQAFGNGYLSVEQANLILNHLPMEITFVNKDDIFQYYNDNTPADEMISSGHRLKLDVMSNYVIHQNIWRRSKPLCKVFVKGKKTSTRCGSSQNHVESLSMSPTLQYMMKTGNFKVCWSMFRTSNPTVRLIQTFSVD